MLETEERTVTDEVQPEGSLETETDDQLDSDASDGDQARPPEAAATVDLSTMPAQLSQMERASATQLSNLERQLARLEGRFDRGGESAASVRELRKEIAETRGAVAGITDQIGEIRAIRAALSGIESANNASVQELRELVELAVRRTAEPEEIEALQRAQAERRQATEKTQLEHRATVLEQRAANAERALAERLVTINLQPPPEVARPASVRDAPPPPERDPAYIRATNTLDKRVRGAGYDPDDTTFQTRIITRANELAGAPVSTLATHSDRLDVLTDALLAIQSEDKRTEADTARKIADDAAKERAKHQEAASRTAARTQVVTDRSRAGSGTRSYTTMEELEAAFAHDEIDAAAFREFREKLPRRR